MMLVSGQLKLKRQIERTLLLKKSAAVRFEFCWQWAGTPNFQNQGELLLPIFPGVSSADGFGVTNQLAHNPICSEFLAKSAAKFER
jgi:hypothetical protein